jgi:glucose/arabinose dehydrogenase
VFSIADRPDAAPDLFFDPKADLKTLALHPGAQGVETVYGLAFHPKFADNRECFVCYTLRGKRGEKNLPDGTRVSRFRVSRTDPPRIEPETEEVLLTWLQGGHNGGDLHFGLDGYLYISTGDATDPNPPDLFKTGQDISDLLSSVLRIDVDRTENGKPYAVPKDNPFVGKAGAKPEIYTYGHRNGYGLAVHPETGELWQAEIGPMGGDEVNILQPGHNYGWPLVSMGRNYTGTLASDQPFARPGMDNARMFWVPSISPSSIMFYTGDKFPRWKNNLFVGALTTQQLIRVAFNQPSQAERREGLLVGQRVRIRDIQQSPDGYIYVVTEGASGGTALDGMVLKIEPADQ